MRVVESSALKRHDVSARQERHSSFCQRPGMAKVASRDYVRGDIIFEEKPLAVRQVLDNRFAFPACAVCHRAAGGASTAFDGP